MKLIDLLDSDKCRIISIVGAGGKSTLMYTLSDELRDNNKVLVTTTTKIYLPEKKQYDYIALNDKEFYSIRCSNNKGVYIYGVCINEENKLIGPEAEIINQQQPYFHYILIEADGSKRKPIKGWKDNEPVVCSSTQTTVGVLSIDAIGKTVNEDNVHRVEEFTKITGSTKYEKITVEDMCSVICHPNGLFKSARGEKILFINKVEREIDKFIAEILLNNILENNKNYIDKTIFGSLKNKDYEIRWIRG